MKKLLLLLCVSFGFVLSAWAQDRTISGKVTAAEDGSPLPGVNVLIKGTTVGVVTDADGNYKLAVNSSNPVLVFSFIGFANKEIEAGQQSVVDVQLSADVTQLSEVVVVGYGTQLKQDLTGNVASVKGDVLKNIPVPTFEQALQGRAAGVFIEAGNGKLGQGIKVRVRGSSSVSAGNQPLYVIDGIPMTSNSQSNIGGQTNPLTDINPADIASIEILKDASAAAIYGSRAANGVVIITTKKGKAGKTSFNIGYQTGFSEATGHREWLNTAEFVELFTESNGGMTNSLTRRFNRYGADPLALTTPTSNNTPHESWITPGAPGYVDTDWEKEALKRGTINQVDLNASGGTEKTKFYGSFSYSDQEGILIGNRFKRLSGRVNLDHQATEKLSLGMNFSFSKSLNYRLADDNAFSTPMQIIALSPMTPVIDPRTNLISGVLNPVSGLPNGNFPLYYNPLIDNQYNSRVTEVFRNFGSVYANYKITKGLTFRSEVGYDLLNQHEERYYAKESSRNSGQPNGESNDIWTQVFNYTTNNFLQFTKNFSDLHAVEAIAGMSYQESNNNFGSVSGQQFPSNAYKEIVSAATISAGNSQESQFTFLSYFARANYKFRNKYLVSLSGRVDGSSRFGVDNRYGFFPAGSVGWVISEEGFMDNLKVVDFLKLRASYGVVGNAEIGNFDSYGLYSGDGGVAGVPGQRPFQIANPNLGWEKTAQLNVGLDLGVLDNRITVGLDYYIKKTTDLLLNVNLAGATGYRTQTQNVGELENKGFEFVLNTENLVGAVRWTTNINFAINKNEIVSLDGQLLQGDFLSVAKEGEPLGIFYGPKYAGVDVQNGDALYYIVNSDGTQSTTNDYNAATYQKIGDPNPNMIAGITNTITFKGIDFSFLFQGVYGNQVYNGGGKFMSANGDFFDNQTKDQMRRWRNPGDVTDVPQARLFGANGTGESSRYVSDASYTRLKNVTLGYNLPASMISKLKLSSLRVYFIAQNLLTFTKYEGWDPEVNADTYAGNNINQGIDFYSAPQAKSITFGINIGF
jgi:TonB-dependent starch-binding outer membrane protein SusC